MVKKWIFGPVPRQDRGRVIFAADSNGGRDNNFRYWQLPLPRAANTPPCAVRTAYYDR